MTLYDLFENSGIAIQGNIRIQRWDNEIDPTIFFDGDSIEFSIDKHGDIMYCEVTYMFPYMTDYNQPAMCIEISED